MLYFLMMLLLGGIWAFCIAVQIDRPDLITFIPLTNQFGVDVAFAALQVAAVLYVSWVEIRNNHFNATQIIRLLRRNLIIISLGVVLLIFTSRELLNGIDPTGHAPILGMSPPHPVIIAPQPATNPLQPLPNGTAH